jgi:hypothetical protein
LINGNLNLGADCTAINKLRAVIAGIKPDTYINQVSLENLNKQLKLLLNNQPECEIKKVLKTKDGGAVVTTKANTNVFTQSSNPIPKTNISNPGTGTGFDPIQWIEDNYIIAAVAAFGIVYFIMKK